MMSPMHAIQRLYQDPCRVLTERLGDSRSDLKTFCLKYSANFYVFSYDKEGKRRHTFIDTGDYIYRRRILAILHENNVDPKNIERIIITHHHIDHCGLADVLAGESGAKILVHANFRNFVEGEITRELRPWLGGFVPARLQRRAIDYLKASEKAAVPISGLNFPRLTEPMQIGDAGSIEILACPESAQTHSANQIIVIYSPRSHLSIPQKTVGRFRPDDNIIFSGDLWLMQGPLFGKTLRHLYRQMKATFYYRVTSLLSGTPMSRWEPREQDTEAKEALKLGFPLIRVKPGHGEEFLGTRIIPKGVFADRDILLALGYPMDGDKATLKKESIAPKVAAILETAYADFTAELLFWTEQGYDAKEISAFLLRIYQEQEGGGRLVEEDRKERRKRLKQTLSRLRDEATGGESLRRIAEMTFPALSF